MASLELEFDGLRRTYGPVKALDGLARLATRIYTASILRTGPRISFRQAIRESRNA